MCQSHNQTVLQEATEETEIGSSQKREVSIGQ